MKKWKVRVGKKWKYIPSFGYHELPVTEVVIAERFEIKDGYLLFFNLDVTVAAFQKWEAVETLIETRGGGCLENKAFSSST